MKKTIDRCVLCGKDTGFYKDTHIKERICYVVGVGQLCSECFQGLQRNVIFVENEDDR